MWLDQILTHKVKARPKNTKRRGARTFLHLLPSSSAGRNVRSAGSQFTNGLRQKERRRREIGSAARVCCRSLSKMPLGGKSLFFLFCTAGVAFDQPTLYVCHTRAVLLSRTWHPALCVLWQAAMSYWLFVNLPASLAVAAPRHTRRPPFSIHRTTHAHHHHHLLRHTSTYSAFVRSFSFERKPLSVASMLTSH